MIHEISLVFFTPRLRLSFLSVINLCLFLVLCTSSSANAANSYLDDFSGTLENWEKYGGSWYIKNGILTGYYELSCGRTDCPQADLILKDEFQPTGDWRASIDFIRTRDLEVLNIYQAIGNFAVWSDSSNRISLIIGNGGESWGGIQDEIRVSVSIWRGYWERQFIEFIPYQWDPSEWNKASIKKVSNTYYFYINDKYLAS